MAAPRRRHFEGLAAGLTTFTALRAKADEDRREFDRRLQEAGIKAGIETGAIAPRFGPQGQFAGFAKGPGAITPEAILQRYAPLLQSTGPGGGYKIDLDVDPRTGAIKSLGFRAKEEKVLAPKEQLTQDIISAQSAIPQMQARTAPLLAAIASSRPMGFGVSERVLSERPTSIGRATEIARQPLLQSQQRLNQLRRTASVLNQSGLLGTPGFVDVGLTEDDPIALRIQQLQSEGMPDERIAQFLREKGIDPASYGL